MVNTSVEFRRPGVFVSETPLPRQVGSVTGTSARPVIIGYADRGPTTPVPLSSWNEFLSLFGTWKGDGGAHDVSVDAVYTYFNNAAAGGSVLTFLRLTKPGAATGTATVLTGDAEHPITLRASSPGAWSASNLTVQTSKVSVASGGAFSSSFSEEFDTFSSSTTNAAQFNVLVQLTDSAGEVIAQERYRNLDMLPTSRNYAPSIINSSSALVQVDTTTLTGSTGIPVDGTYAFTGGADGSGNITADFTPLDSLVVPLTLYLANANNVTTGNTAIAEYATRRGDSFAILDTSEAQTSQALDEQFYSSLGAPITPYAAMYFPWLIIADPLRSSGVLKPVAPGGSVLGVYSRNDAVAGPWRAPGGPLLPLSGVAAPTRRLSEDELSFLNSGAPAINAIRTVSGSGVCIMGVRTMDQSNADQYIPIRRSLSYITANLKNISEYALFQPNGPELWLELQTKIDNWLGLYYQRGALRGAREDQAFYSIIDSSNNTAATVAAGEVHIEVGVAVEFPAEFVIIRLTQTQGALN